MSNPKLEETLRVRLEFMVFAGFGMDGSVPDEVMVCRFRNRLTEKGLLDKLFEQINLKLTERGLLSLNSLPSNTKLSKVFFD